jgi:hypothetical protein
MRGIRVFKWAVTLLVIVAFYGAYKVLNSPLEQVVYKVVKVNSTVTLYMTEGSAGATTNFVYQFYLAPSTVTKSDFLKDIGDKYHAFLSTSDENTKIEIIDGNIHLGVRGDVYGFQNGVLYSTTIYLNAAPF